MDTINGTGFLAGENVASAWTFNGGTGTYNDGSHTLGYNVGGFTTFNAGSGGDTFTVTAATPATLNGGAGNDSFQFTGTGNVTGSINGGGGTNTLTGNNAASTWSIASANGGTLTDGNGANTFTGMQNLTGGSGDDNFVFANAGTIGGSLNGGAQPSADTLNLSAKAGAVTFNLQAGTANGITGTFSAIESLVGNGTTTTLIGVNAGTTYTLSGANSGTAGATAYSGVGNITAGTGADTFTGTGGSLSGNLSDGGGATTVNGTYSTTGSQTYTGAVTIASATTLNAGSSVTFASTVTGSTFAFNVVAGTSIAAGTMNVGSGQLQLTAGTTITGSVAGTSPLQNTFSAGPGSNPLFAINFPNVPLLLTGATSTWQLSGPVSPLPNFAVTDPLTNIFYNGNPVSGAAVIAINQSGSAIASTLADIARAALLESQDTDSVQKQIAYGFAGDVGNTPPMDHRIDETGISVPICFNDSREGQTCR
jgi:hypothetical protein